MKGSIGGIVVALVVIAVIVGLLWGWPKYRVYNQTMRGRAAYAEAEQNRRIAELDAQAEIARSRGVAEANRIIAESITDEYVRWLFVDQLDEIRGQVIYVPTEANIPIMEAARLIAAPPAE